MKVAGIVLIVWGGLAVLAAINQVMRGFEANFAGLSLIVLGTFLISRAKKKQEEKNKRTEPSIRKHNPHQTKTQTQQHNTKQTQTPQTQPCDENRYSRAE